MRQPSPGPAFRNNVGGWTLGAGHAGPREPTLGLGAGKSGPWAGPSCVWASRKALASPWVGAEEPWGQRPRRGPVRVAWPQEGTVPGAEWDGNADWRTGATAGPGLRRGQENRAGHWGFPLCEVILRLIGLWGRKGPAGIAPAGGQDLALGQVWPGEVPPSWAVSQFPGLQASRSGEPPPPPAGIHMGPVPAHTTSSSIARASSRVHMPVAMAARSVLGRSPGWAVASKASSVDMRDWESFPW